MNELIQSEPELYAADVDETYIQKSKKKNSERDKLKAEIQNHLNQESLLSAQNQEDLEIYQRLFNVDEISLEDPDDQMESLKELKEKNSKIHNSFTGPYPLDPTEFNHTDKGENY